MEKEFHSNLEKKRVEIHEQLKNDFKREITRHSEDVVDKQEQIEELREIK